MSEILARGFGLSAGTSAKTEGASGFAKAMPDRENAERVAARVGFCALCGHALPDEDGVVFDADSCTVTRGGVSVRLSRGEFEMATFLRSKHGGVARHDAIYDYLYQLHDDPPLDAIIKVHASRLRLKLNPLGIGVTCRWRIGYALDVGKMGEA